MVVHEIDTLASNDLTKMADWVAYRVTPASIGPSGERKKWSIPGWTTTRCSSPTTTTARPRRSAWTVATRRRSRRSRTPRLLGTNILSNITRQGAPLNQTPWQRLEARETALADAENVAVHVLTGPLFERVMPPLPGADERLRPAFFPGPAKRDMRDLSAALGCLPPR